MEKSNKGLYAGIIVAVILVVAVIVGVIISRGNGEDVGEGTDETQIEEVSRFDEVDQDIAFGSFDEMKDLSKSIQNGEITGQVVRIEGFVSHPMTKYSIVQENEDGSEKIGTEFVIEGVDESEYPQDGTRVIITGEVFEKEPLYYVIKTTPEYVMVVEDVEEDVIEDVEEVVDDAEAEE